MGDISDNISSVLSKCGPKTAIKCLENPVYFEERLKKENAYEKYEVNKKIIDFDYIPKNLSDEFMKTIISV
jgi:5'-3' exonuclease